MSEKGNAVSYFWEAVRKGHIAHFYLFYGEKRDHREQALALAAALNCLKGQQAGAGWAEDVDGEPLFCGECTACRKIFSGCHPDVNVIGPAKTSIGIEQITALQKKVSRKPYEGFYQVYIIEEAEKLTLPAANALLVTAEEPSARTVLVLSCASDAAILPTLRSRARAVYFPPEDEWLPWDTVAADTNGQGARFAGETSFTEDICLTVPRRTGEGRLTRESWRLSGNNAVLAREIERVGAELIRDLTDQYEAAVSAGDFLRLFALFPLEREIALVWLQVMAADAVARLRKGEGAVTRQQDAAMVLPWLEEALRALQRQADVRLTVEVLALKHMRGLNLWRK